MSGIVIFSVLITLIVGATVAILTKDKERRDQVSAVSLFGALFIGLIEMLGILVHHIATR